MAIRDTGARDPNLSGMGTIAAIFHDHDKADQAVSDLLSAGFTRQQVGVAVKEPESGMNQSWIQKIRNKFSEKSEPVAAENRDYYTSQYAPDTLQSMGLDSATSNHIRDAMDRGDALVTVKAGARQADAIAILKRNGASVGSDLAQNIGTTGTTARRDIAERRPDVVGGQRLQLFGEMLRVHKDRIQSGEVRLRKEVVTENKRIDVPVEREELVIERIPGGDKPVGDARIGDQKEIRVPLTEERVRVDKQPILNEEVRVGKREVTNVQHVDDTVRHEEVRVENEGKANVRDNLKDKEANVRDTLKDKERRDKIA